MIKAPIPLSDPIHSPTIAPITAVVDAILNDEKSIGMERGNLKRQKVSHWVAERILNNSISLGLGEFSPRIILTRVGKKQMTADMMILGVIPKPKISMMIGAKARIGMVLKKRTTGK